MLGFEPFEPKPFLAVAVSGGPDSMALCLLAHRWARKRGGRVLALTVDHRLRRESAEEARQVGRWLKRLGIAHEILVWDALRPRANIAALARGARYRLLSEAAVRRGILHLLLAHHLDDQAETLLLRLGRGSGVDGLSAIAPESWTEDLRLLRPLLPVPKARLVATLKAMRQGFVEDPSNLSADSARARLRDALAAIGDAGLTARRLGETAGRMARARQALEGQAAALAAQAASIHPAGFVVLKTGPLAGAPEEIRLRLLARCLMAVSGEAYPPRLESLEALAGALAAPGFRGRTLHGCRLAPLGGDAVLICREPAAAAGSAPLPAGVWGRWDGRFAVRAGAGSGLSVGPLGAAGWAALTKARAAPPGVPRAAALTLPAIWAGNRLVVVPSLGPGMAGVCAEGDGRRPAQTDKIPMFSAVFAPFAPLAQGGPAIALAAAVTT
jgi:tRNA(Ile)-lysidine synthase